MNCNERNCADFGKCKTKNKHNCPKGNTETTKLTDEQIKHWRKILAMSVIGPYAWIMPKETVQKIKDKYQNAIDSVI